MAGWGPGLRRVLLLKGCPPGCEACWQPEVVSPFSELRYDPYSCGACGDCRDVCDTGAWDGWELRRQLCTVCGKCAAACSCGALRITGQRVTAGQVVNRLLAERRLVGEGVHGGLTLAGAEVEGQIDFAERVLVSVHRLGVHTCLRTCGHLSPEAAGRLAPYVDLFLLDIGIWAAGKGQRSFLELFRGPLKGKRLRVRLIVAGDDGVCVQVVRSLGRQLSRLPALDKVCMVPADDGLILRQKALGKGCDHIPRSTPAERLIEIMEALQRSTARPICSQRFALNIL